MFGAQTRGSEGSGVLVDPEGVVLTNAHVVGGARRIQVTLSDGRTFEADLVAQDTALDLAVIRLRGASGLPVVAWGSSDDVLLGETVVAIGNPFGLGLTVSTGVVASTGRDVNVGDGPVQTYLQTDAAINPGNSGGALVDLRGRLVGINTFIQAGAEGIGFAIPVDRARKIAEDLLAYGRVQLPWLGATLNEVGPRRVRGAPKGALRVDRVWKDGPLDQAGIVPGDLLVALDGHDTVSRGDLNARLAELHSGAALQLTRLREGIASEIRVTSGQPPGDLGVVVLRDLLGVGVRSVAGGLEVTRVSPEGAWARAGLQAGDLLLAVDGRRVAARDDLLEHLGDAAAHHRDRAWFTVRRGNRQGTLDLPL